MELHLTRPLAFFDIETTGTHFSRDRIVEISILKALPDHTTQVRTWLVNPGIPIPPEITAIHGITNEMVADKPYFKDVAREINTFIGNADLAGYNSNKFDIPMLAEEMLRAGVDFDLSKRRFVDVQNIFHKMEPRNLAAAYRFYCQRELENAHSAEADVTATYEILKAQLDRYPELKNDIGFLSEFSTRNQNADLAGFIAYNAEGKEIFTFGKYKGLTLEEVFEKDSGYYSWMLNADFPLYTKKVLTAVRLSKMTTK
ncbi:DNA polymerase III subunit epsilon [Thermaurantimonas aggregans]|uniref:DNA polymerase III subunit epsilon n=1 Tax=Thermaurantimonas aggregans TaxID=2173829 RepID=A0A401XMW6_9FLAO|nr:3'-5' exonuclease [Thermaurantimonas aggregans]MCX8148110.1 3'-5' exonuclease [Thermaurantimonas aggregans]GCD78336.1 DNA polymerase III subunit epsilon [Thermaurantimonas aggregans]